jgi:endonuclease-8
MPEGDTIHTLAGALRRELLGRRLERVEVRGRRVPSLASEVVAVEARGKNLLLTLGTGEAIRVHLGMSGDWHRYSERARSWRRSPARATLVLHTGDCVIVCFDAEELELVEASRLARSRGLRTLGPDLISGPASAEVLVRRARHFLRATAPVVDLLLDQRVAAGIGNVYKSELLFLEGIAPRTPIGALDDERIASLYQLAARLLRANVGGVRRVTTGEPGGARGARPPLWVYRRVGEPCLRCGTRIEFTRLGRDRRGTYWCPSCQEPAARR